MCVNDRATFQLQLKLNSFSGVVNKHGNAKEFVNAADNHLKSANPQNIYSEAESLFTAILAEKDYVRLLKHYNRKSLINQVAAKLNMNREGYRKLILTALRTPPGQPLTKLGIDLRDAFQSCVPMLPEKAQAQL